MRNGKVTIKEVAEKAGVSVSTVSHVLNGNDQHVGPLKRARVLEVVRELNYRPNAIARSMVKRVTATIGLVITELDNPLFVPVAEGVEEVLKAEGYHIVLASANDLEGEIRAIETLRGQQVDGFIFMSLSIRYPSDHILNLKADGIPFVVINRNLEESDINLVQLDDFGAGRTATLHLLSLGYGRIGTISGPLGLDLPRRSALERQRGWLSALQECGRVVNPDWIIEGGYTFEGGYRAVKALLARCPLPEQRPQALFIANESMAVGALKALHEAGLAIPGEMAVVTVGDPPFAAYTYPALTTLTLPVLEAGKVAARILVENLKSPKPLPPQSVTLASQLRIRESCGANPGKNE